MRLTKAEIEFLDEVFKKITTYKEIKRLHNEDKVRIHKHLSLYRKIRQYEDTDAEDN
jgi:hypothetical protein